MATLLLIPLEDTVVFPTMDVTLPVDVGDEERVLLVPRHDGEYATVGTIAHVAERVRLPGGGRGAMFEGVARGVAGAAATDSRGRLAWRSPSAPTTCRSTGARASSSASTARRRGDPRAARRRRPHRRLAALDLRARRARRHLGLLARPDLRAEGRDPRDARRHRAPGAGARLPARAPGRAAGAPQDPRGRRGRRRQAAARVRAAQADGVDPPRARRGRRLDRRRVPHEDRRGRHARRRA